MCALLSENPRRTLSFDEMVHSRGHFTCERVLAPGDGSDGSSFSGSDVDHPSRCVCQICTCGKHRCRPENRLQPSHAQAEHYTTTYGGNFVPHEAATPQRHSPKEECGRPTLAAPGHYTTNYSADYVPHPTYARRDCSPARHDIVKVAPRPDQYVTTMGSNYVPHDVEKHSPMRARGLEEGPLPQRPFNAHTTYSDEFVPRQATSTPRMIRTEVPLERKPFQGDSTYHDNFGRPSYVIPVRVRPVTQEVRVPENRDFLTEAHNQFVPHYVEPCPAIFLPPKTDHNRGDHYFYSPSRHGGRITYK